MPDGVLILVGGGLVFAGLVIAGGRRKRDDFVGNKAFNVFGSITQTFRSAGMAIGGKRQRTARDWIGWGLGAAGLIVGLIGLVNF